MFGRYTKRGQTEMDWTMKDAKAGTGRQEVQRRPKRRFMGEREDVVLMCCSGDP